MQKHDGQAWKIHCLWLKYHKAVASRDQAAIAIAAQAMQTHDGQDWKIHRLWLEYHKAVASRDQAAIAIAALAIAALAMQTHDGQAWKMHCLWLEYYKADHDDLDARLQAVQKLVDSTTALPKMFQISVQTKHLLWSEMSNEQQVVLLDWHQHISS